MSSPDGLLAVDIETASPHKEPGRGDFQDTSYFELVAVGLGYQPGPEEEIETEVLFRNGGWETEPTSDLLQRAYRWCDERDADAILTHNGERFDEIHLKGWAEEVSERGHWPEATTRIGSLFTSHIDLNPLAVERYQDRLESWRDRVKLEDVCTWENIPVPETRYDEYNLGRLTQHNAIDAPHVTNVHIGEVLGEAYVEHKIRGTTETQQFQELERLLRHYTEADIAPLFHLARRFNTSNNPIFGEH
jgi:hypothetical protein